MEPATFSFVPESESTGRAAFDSLALTWTSVREPQVDSRKTYLDTFDWRLHDAGLRLYIEPGEAGNELSLGTVAGALIQRATVDRAPVFTEDLPDGSFSRALVEVVEMRRLLPVVTANRSTETLRLLDKERKTVARVEWSHGTACSISTSGQSHPPVELQPTLRVVPVRGYDDGERIAERLAAQPGLYADRATDLERLLIAVGRRAGDYSSKPKLQLDPTQSCESAVREILLAMLDTIEANEEGTRQDLDSEFLHDFRVSVRRTRACLSQVRKTLPAEKLDHFAGEFRWLGRLTGPTRDLDVHLLTMPRYRQQLPGNARRDLEPLEQYLETRQKAEQSELARELAGERYRGLVTEWRDFLRDAVPRAGAPANAFRSVGVVAAERIEKVHRRVLKWGRKLHDGSPDDKFHALRIECKKLRYLLEFFRSLFDRSDIDPTIKALKRLQDNLGEFNDVCVQQQALRRFASAILENRPGATATVLAMGRVVEQLARRQREVRDCFTVQFDEFAAEEGHMVHMLGRGSHDHRGETSS